MKKTVLLFFIFCPFYLFFCQVIKGKVVNENNQIIPGVNIYLDGSTTKTTSEDDGSFALQINTPNATVVFQKENYITYTTQASLIVNKTSKIVLTKETLIEEVELVPYTEETYKKYIHDFLNQFIGDDQKNVKIKNKRTLKFSYHKKHRILKVKAPQPLIIENNNLGYQIEYNLVNFTADFNKNITQYFGTSFFKETKNDLREKLNRMNAYEGSNMHFFRSICSSKVSNEGYIVNHVIKVPNPKYPSEHELGQLEAYPVMMRNSKTISIPKELVDISSRKINEKPYNLAIIKTQITESDYTRKKDNSIFFDFKDILQVNYKKHFYELKNI